MADETTNLQLKITALTAQLEQANRNRANVEDNPNRPLRNFTAPKADEIQLGHTAPNILTEEYQIPSRWINAVQRTLFHGLLHEDETQHRAHFEEPCSMLKIRTITQEDKAKNWIRGQKPKNMDTWAKIADTFLNRFFPRSKTSSIRHKIHNFQQRGDKMICEV
jgi:Retrotransposon gag protein